MVKMYNEFYDLDVVKRTKDLIDLPQGMIVKKFNILYGNDISDLAEGSVVMVADIKLKTLGFFRKNKDENTFNIRDRGANWDVVFMDVTSHTGLDFDTNEYFKEDDSKSVYLRNPSIQESIDDALKENYIKTPKGYIKKDENLVDQEIQKENDSLKSDAVNQPSHYTSGDIEVIEYIEQQAKVMYDSGTVPPEVIPHICNAIKYISRFQSKGKPVEDLNKSIYYINRAIKNIEDSKE